MFPLEQKKHSPAMKRDGWPLPTISFYVSFDFLFTGLILSIPSFHSKNLISQKKKYEGNDGTNDKHTSIPDDLPAFGIFVSSFSIILTLRPLQSPKLDVLNGKLASLF